MNPAGSPMLFDRQKCLLALLGALGGRVGNLDFQKLLFLYCAEDSPPPAPYDFVPYRFGAFSFTSYADRRKLIERGLLVDDEHSWHLTSSGQTVLDALPLPKTPFAAFVDKHGGRRGDALVAETYRRHPYYATRSEMAERVLRGDVVALQRVEAARRTTSTARLSTIGYEGRTLERYLNSLLAAGVTLLCDVRRNPLSRKYGFSKGTLSKGCEGVGLRYEHLPALGIASDERQNLKTQADYDTLFARYERESLPMQAAALDRIAEWLAEGERVALTCYEELPQQCHRHCVAESLERRLGAGVHAQHL